MEYDELCKKIMNLDNEIRFVGILGKNGDIISGGLKEGVDCFLTPNEAKMSLHYSSQRYETRKNLSYKIGRPKHSMTVYEKIKQFSIPLNNNDILLISTGLGVEHEKLIAKTLNLINENLKTS
jgi:hypothetical protein